MGRSLDELIRGDAAHDERIAFSELYTAFPGVPIIARMVRKGPWKYNYYHGAPSELFNMDEDPDEFHNLAGDPAYQRVCRELEELVLDGWDPEKISLQRRVYRERVSYMRRWSKAVNPPDPDHWEGLEVDHPQEWKDNALAIPEYAAWLRRQ